MTKKILIVEDEADIRAALTAWFDDEGFETAEADNGIGGLVEFERSSPNIALLDVNMPGMNGIELCHEIRQFSRTPLVMFTADADVDEVKSVIAEGATDWVLKTGGFEALIDRITEHLNITRSGISESELEEPVSAQVLSSIEPVVDGHDQLVELDAAGELKLDAPSPDDLFAWNGAYFGFRDGAELYTYLGKHVGRFRRNGDIYRPNGLYMGDVRDGRLIVDWHKTARRASSFTPSSDRAGRPKFADREPLDLQIGFKDFPDVEDLPV